MPRRAALTVIDSNALTHTKAEPQVRAGALLSRTLPEPQEVHFRTS